MIHPDRISGDSSGAAEAGGDHVLYWMQDAVRSTDNHALEYAIQRANDLKKPLRVVFSLHDRYPDATLRHYSFLADGLVDTAGCLEARGIRMQVLIGEPQQTIPDESGDAALLVCDGGPLQVQRAWKEAVKERVSCPVVGVETGTIVPVRTASPRAEWSAGTFRPKITRHLSSFLTPLSPRSLNHPSLGWDDGGIPLKDPRELLSRISPDPAVPPVGRTGGETAAERQFSWFLQERFSRYHDSRNDPTARATSQMSAYLHFGQISPLTLALRVLAVQIPGSADVIEQMVVRRELAVNFVWYTPGCDQYLSAVPEWARKSLSRHQSDSREYLYSRAELEAGRTHDPYWNAMQTELVLTGSLHGYLRMYWGKKILEWSPTPEEAFSTALYLNNRYQLDGRDPNGYAGVAWCFGRHDRPWKERPVFGMIRYMNAAGLKRKFRIEAYRERIELMAARQKDEAG